MGIKHMNNPTLPTLPVFIANPQSDGEILAALSPQVIDKLNKNLDDKGYSQAGIKLTYTGKEVISVEAEPVQNSHAPATTEENAEGLLGLPFPTSAISNGRCRKWHAHSHAFSPCIRGE